MRSYAFDVRRLETGALVGVGIVTPSDRSLLFLADGATRAVAPDLSPELWEEIVEWAVEGDEHLPAQPVPIGARVVAALVEDADASAVIADRFAAIAYAVDVEMAHRLLPQLLIARQRA